MKIGVRYDWEPDRAGIFDDWKDYYFVGGQQCLLLFAPEGGGESFQDFDRRVCFFFGDFGMFSEGESWIQRESKDFRVFNSWNGGVVDG